MTYLDKVLTKLVSNHQTELNTRVQSRDSSTLRSLANSVVGQYFITENQSRLLVKLLKENHHLFGVEMSKEITTALETPMWSRPFRIIEQVKKLYVKTIGESNQVMVIDFTFSAHVRKAITQAVKEIENLVQETNGKTYYADFTERNIVTLVELLRPLGFEIEESIENHYDVIKSWNYDDVRNSYLIDTMTSKNFHKCIAEDLGVDTPIDDNIICDRSVRYRYFPKPIEQDGTLTRYIATRGKTKIWINKQNHTLDDVIKSLVDLKRLPAMFVFDSHDQSKAHEILETLSQALEANSVTGKVGIYFRLPNTDNGIKFNEIIANKHYNQYLDTDTAVVGVQSGKIPKFFLTSNWRPMSVVAIDTQLRSSKTAVYANYCDLIITYSDTVPIIENQEKWQ